jgi:hypothetical protein
LCATSGFVPLYLMEPCLIDSYQLHADLIEPDVEVVNYTPNLLLLRCSTFAEDNYKLPLQFR